MTQQLPDETGIPLQDAAGDPLRRVYVGLDWGAMTRRRWFWTRQVPVDLDSSCAVFDAQGQLMDLVYYGKLRSADGAVHHGGDDLTGDLTGDDDADNESIVIDLTQLAPRATTLAVLLVSAHGPDFFAIPYARIQLFADARFQHQPLAAYEVAADPTYTEVKSMVMGIFRKSADGWRFVALGRPIAGDSLEHVVKEVQQHWL